MRESKNMREKKKKKNINNEKKKNFIKITAFKKEWYKNRSLKLNYLYTQTLLFSRNSIKQFSNYIRHFKKHKSNTLIAVNCRLSWLFTAT